jgi:hypothetical protein
MWFQIEPLFGGNAHLPPYEGKKIKNKNLWFYFNEFKNITFH